MSEPIAAIGDAKPAEALRIAREGSACPECHEVLAKIKEGPITRYRCHTGGPRLFAPIAAGGHPRKD